MFRGSPRRRRSLRPSRSRPPPACSAPCSCSSHTPRRSRRSGGWPAFGVVDAAGGARHGAPARPHQVAGRRPCTRRRRSLRAARPVRAARAPARDRRARRRRCLAPRCAAAPAGASAGAARAAHRRPEQARRATRREPSGSARRRRGGDPRRGRLPPRRRAWLRRASCSRCCRWRSPSPVGLALSGRSLHPRARLALGVLIPLLLALLAWDVSFQEPDEPPGLLSRPGQRHPARALHAGRRLLAVRRGRHLLPGRAPGAAAVRLRDVRARPGPPDARCCSPPSTSCCAWRPARSCSPGSARCWPCSSSSIATLGRWRCSIRARASCASASRGCSICALVLAHRRERPARRPLIAAYALVGVARGVELRDGLLYRRDVRRDGGRRGLARSTGAARGASRRPTSARALPRDAGHRSARDRRRSSGAGGARQIGGLPRLPASVLGRRVRAAARAELVARLPHGRALRRLADRPWPVACVDAAASWPPSTLVPLAAVSAFGAVCLTYFLGRSHPNNLSISRRRSSRW